MTLYDDLGVPRDAKPDEIKKAFRSKAKKAHPDRKGGSNEEMQVINRAYMILSDPEKRERYDSQGDDGSAGVKPTIEQRAQQALFQAFAQLIDNAPESVDWFALLRQGIEQQRHKIGLNKSKAGKEIKKCEKIIKRIKGGTLFNGLMQQRLLNARNIIAQCDEELEVCEASMKMLDGYEMEPDPDAKTSQWSQSPTLEALYRRF